MTPRAEEEKYPTETKKVPRSRLEREGGPAGLVIRAFGFAKPLRCKSTYAPCQNASLAGSITFFADTPYPRKEQGTFSKPWAGERRKWWD